MDRRRFLAAASASLSAYTLPAWAQGSSAPRLLIFLELRGGNDGLNTVIPQDGRYQDLRPRLALKDDALIAFERDLALHRELAPLQALWRDRQMAVLHGVGYPQADLSHFRSIAIWDTASAANVVLEEGWLSRAAMIAPSFRTLAADGAIIGAPDLGPLAGRARAVAVNDPGRFAQQAQFEPTTMTSAQGALAHILRVEADIAHAGASIRSTAQFATEFPRGPTGQAVARAAGLAATRQMAVLRLTLPGFDTHTAQLPRHSALLAQVAQAVVALRAALTEVGVWQDTLVLTYSEFGRRPKENGSGGTDHGTATVHFAFGEKVRGGEYGERPALHRLDAQGNLGFAIDFRTIYATVLEQWWQLDSRAVLGERFAPLPFLKV
jgi:uncharacterized protein (DUF1501 family)